MRFDVFCSLAQTPRPGGLPEHATILREFLDQAMLADELGYECVWVAESHFSSEVQKRHQHPVIPHWTGEVGVNTDICQLAPRVFDRTSRVDVGSAILNIVAGGGPVVAAERVATALAWHGLDPAERRRLRIGFAGGRFEFIARTTGITPRGAWEAAGWRQVKQALLWEAGEVFVRLLRGETLAAQDVAERWLGHGDFPDAEAFEHVASLAGVAGEQRVRVPRRWDFEATKIVPDRRADLLRLYAGTHDAGLQTHLNQFRPVRAFNLSITPPAVIEATHERLAGAYNLDGGKWQRSYLPRTTFVFLDASAGASRATRRERAQRHAREALAAYWQAMEGTLDERRVADAVGNALVGAPEDIAEQIVARFHPDDRLMLWFDFFPRDGRQVLIAMEEFRHRVVPLLRDAEFGGHEIAHA
ncbi:luciferase [Amycolatopsis antarctica]|uniref:Luciferase n=1 Tax=Amycolatopsis antarctica TaxID=1854586 RepID=A0A263D458_9PSEU|nr:LLM class flavin-dependent oxidoreductase [Amycolatopsis antarctica]OZM72145.1 luciferase [Amycolatopsis antarctica]